MPYVCSHIISSGLGVPPACFEADRRREIHTDNGTRVIREVGEKGAGTGRLLEKVRLQDPSRRRLRTPSVHQREMGPPLHLTQKGIQVVSLCCHILNDPIPIRGFCIGYILRCRVFPQNPDRRHLPFLCIPAEVTTPGTQPIVAHHPDRSIADLPDGSKGRKVFRH
jgi:hypothetical protein